MRIVSPRRTLDWFTIMCAYQIQSPQFYIDFTLQETTVQVGLSTLWKCQLLSRIRLFMTPWIVACQAPLSMEFSRQEYYSGQPFPSPKNLPDPGIEPRSPLLQTDSLLSEPPPCPGVNGTLVAVVTLTPCHQV